MVSSAKSFPFLSRESSSTEKLIVANPHILDEHTFIRMLRVERKRTERSGRPFMLVLLDGERIAQSAGTLNSIVAAIDGATRETDTLGWYLSGTTLGILFTEIGEAAPSAIERILENVSSSLTDHLDAEVASSLSISYHLYPETIDSHGKQSTDIRLYPDIQRIADRKKGAQSVKRVIDVIGSSMAILALAPIFAVVALAVKLTSKGPVLFKQVRVGQFGKRFTFLKFRSMYTGNCSKIHEEYVKKLIAGQGEKQDGNFKLVNDPRVTAVGRFIRRTSLDELPQFFNVLLGDMSLVGPRPPVPYEYESYDVWHRSRLVEVRPGITGLWQVTGRSRTTFDEMVRLDLQYAGTWTVATDLKILLQTPKAVVSGSGAY